jgi:hypothetical protein
LVHFVTKASLYFCNLHKILRFLMYDMTRFWKKFFHLYVVPDRKNRDLSSSAY